MTTQVQGDDKLKELQGLTEPKKLNLMTNAQRSIDLEDRREQLFIVKMQVKTTIIDAVIDWG